jgi:hypothetical protein
MPWRRWVEICCGGLRWPPEYFWRATLFEIDAAITGYIEAHSASNADDYMTRDELEELKEKYD